MAENSAETPQVKNIWPDFGGYVDAWSRKAYSAGVRAGIRQERARCAALSRKLGETAACCCHLMIAEAIERGER